MGLGSIGDIGSTTFGSVQTLTWEGASEWDAAVSEEGVAHENTANVDHNNAALLKKGYPAATPLFSTNLELYLPLNEDSGTTANDLSGNGRDMSVGSDITQGSTGLVGTTTYSWPGSNGLDTSIDYSRTTIASNSWSLVFWFLTNSSGEQTVHGDSSVSGLHRWIQLDNQKLRFYNGSSYQYSNTTYTLGDWHMGAFVYDDSDGNVYFYLDGSPDGSQANGWSGSDNDFKLRKFGNEKDDSRVLDGKYGQIMVTSSRLSDSQIQTYYDTVAGTSFLTGGTKSFSQSETPDLTDLNYTLNGETIDLNVIGSPGTASEEIVTQTLDGTTSYTLSWSGSHTDFQVKPDLSTADETATPDITSITLTT